MSEENKDKLDKILEELDTKYILEFSKECCRKKDIMDEMLIHNGEVYEMD